MGDRSFFTELVVLFLAATFVFPWSACGSAVKTSGALGVRAESRRATHRGVKATAHVLQPAPDRHISKLRGVLDDDPPILSDNSEDWFEKPTGFALEFPDSPAPGWSPATLQNIGARPNSSHIHGRPMQFLCRYQC